MMVMMLAAQGIMRARQVDSGDAEHQSDDDGDQDRFMEES